MIAIAAAPPFLTVQDLGRLGHRAHGVPRGGAMDRFALRAANLLAGNAPGAAALEWGIGAGAVRIGQATAIGLAGAEAIVTLDGSQVAPYTTLRAPAGSELRIERLTRGRFLYIALGGGLDVPAVLGSRATYLPAGFGGLQGRLLRSGDELPLCRPDGRAPPAGLSIPEELRPRYADSVLRIVRAAQSSLLQPAGWRSLLGRDFRVAAASDRMGYRLEGPLLDHTAAAELPSEGAAAGSLQLPGGTAPIVLMADGPTVGGYAKPAVVVSADLPRLAQRAPGEVVRFTEVSIEQAQHIFRRREIALHTIAHLLSRPAS